MSALRAVDAASDGAAHDDERAPQADVGRWPHSLSHEASLRVSDVLQQLGSEFPALTPSKLRFLDSNGLVSPPRTAAGYRQYSPADVERLRFVLREQRDHFRPLSVIAQTLEALDTGRMHLAVTPHAVEDTAARLTRAELAAAAGADEAVIDTLESEGVVSPSAPGRFERTSVPMVVACAAYLEAGGDLRSLRALVRAAGRETDLIASATTPDRRRGDDAGADADASARADAAIALFSACVHEHIGR